jgi:hypothetical protein
MQALPQDPVPLRQSLPRSISNSGRLIAQPTLSQGLGCQSPHPDVAFSLYKKEIVSEHPLPGCRYGKQLLLTQNTVLPPQCPAP